MPLVLPACESEVCFRGTAPGLPHHLVAGGVVGESQVQGQDAPETGFGGMDVSAFREIEPL
jgi:hypothetical protein